MEKTEPEVRYRYHTADGELHKGHSSTCSICKRKSPMPNSAKRHKQDGSVGGKKSSKRLAPSRKCSECGKKISRASISGMCAQCLKNLSTGKLPKKKARQCSGPGCTNRIRADNKTGYCMKCYHQSEAWEQQRKAHAGWARAMIGGAPPPPAPAAEDA